MSEFTTQPDEAKRAAEEEAYQRLRHAVEELEALDPFVAVTIMGRADADLMIEESMEELLDENGIDPEDAVAVADFHAVIRSKMLAEPDSFRNAAEMSISYNGDDYYSEMREALKEVGINA